MKRMILLFVFMTVLFSCQKPRCGTCETHFSPVIIAPQYFSVCSTSEFNYWNGRIVQYVQYGNNVTATTVCKWGNLKSY